MPTKNGSSKNSSESSKEATNPIDDVKERMSEFKDRHLTHKLTDKQMEAGAEIIKLIFPLGLGTHPHTKQPNTSGWWEGVRIFMPGTMESTLKEEQVSMHERMDPGTTVKFISGAV